MEIAVHRSAFRQAGGPGHATAIDRGCRSPSMRNPDFIIAVACYWVTSGGGGLSAITILWP